MALDWAAAESRMRWEPVDNMSPERQFERNWAMRLLDYVLERLRSEMAADGNSAQFDVLMPSLAGPNDRMSYEEAAAALGCSLDAARQKAHRMRKRYRELLRDAVRQTVADPSEIDDEIRCLFGVFS